MNVMRGSEDEQFDSLMRAFREACPESEPGPNFMPQLWHKIEARQTYTFSFRRMANAFVTAAVAMTIAIGVYMTMSSPSYYTQSYAEVLADANSLDVPDFLTVN